MLYIQLFLPLLEIFKRLYNKTYDDRWKIESDNEQMRSGVLLQSYRASLCVFGAMAIDKGVSKRDLPMIREVVKYYISDREQLNKDGDRQRLFIGVLCSSTNTVLLPPDEEQRDIFIKKAKGQYPSSVDRDDCWGDTFNCPHGTDGKFVDDAESKWGNTLDNIFGKDTIAGLCGAPKCVHDSRSVCNLSYPIPYPQYYQFINILFTLYNIHSD